MRSRSIASGPRAVAEKDTGSYRVQLLDLGGNGEEFVLRVRYTGSWAGGDAVDVHVPELDHHLADYIEEGGPRSNVDAAAKKWFEQNVRGDNDVAGHLVSGGFDQYTNER